MMSFSSGLSSQQGFGMDVRHLMARTCTLTRCKNWPDSAIGIADECACLPSRPAACACVYVQLACWRLYVEQHSVPYLHGIVWSAEQLNSRPCRLSQSIQDFIHTLNQRLGL